MGLGQPRTQDRPLPPSLVPAPAFQAEQRNPEPHAEVNVVHLLVHQVKRARVRRVAMPTPPFNCSETGFILGKSSTKTRPLPVRTFASVVDELPDVENWRLLGAYTTVASSPARCPKLNPSRPPTVTETSCLNSSPLAAFTSSVVGM